MIKKNLSNLRIGFFLILGLAILYGTLSFIICGRLVTEFPRSNNQIIISTNEIYSELKDFTRNKQTIISTSDDPWIMVNLDRTVSPTQININLSDLNVDNTQAQIYYTDKDNDFSEGLYLSTTIRNGINIIEIPDNLRIKTLRFDLTNTKNISMNVSDIRIDLQKNTLVFWIAFILASLVYILFILKIYRAPNQIIHIQKTKQNDIQKVHLKNILFYNNTNEFKLFGISFIVTFLYYLPYVTNTLYSIDDYYLNQLYSINIDTLGYNFQSTGRYIQAVLAEIFYYMNIQPLTKPLGPIIFIGSLSLLGVYFTRVLRIESFKLSLVFILIFNTNPFLAEIFHYSIVPAYSAFAVLALGFGFIFSEIYAQNGQRKWMIFSLVGYIISLMIYQIFFPIVFLILIYRICIPQNLKLGKVKKEDIDYNKFSSLLIYIFSFIIYSIILKICFYIWPPQLEYSGNNIGQLIKNLITAEYWQKIYSNIDLYILKDNPFNSSIVNIVLWILFVGILICYTALKGISKQIEDGKLFYALCVSLIFMFIGVLVCLGFSLLRPIEISSRSLTSFGIYQSMLILLICGFLNTFTIKVSMKKWILVSMVFIILFGNMGRIGRSALDQNRLNGLESNLATRIVARLEMDSHFSPNARLVIMGIPTVGNLKETSLGDYNIPAIQQFSKVFLFNEISGYNFQLPNDNDMAVANEVLSKMEPWPSTKSTKYVDGIFIIKLN